MAGDNVLSSKVIMAGGETFNLKALSKSGLENIIQKEWARGRYFTKS